MGDGSASETRDEEAPPNLNSSYQESPAPGEYKPNKDYLKTPELTPMRFELVVEERKKPKDWFKGVAESVAKYIGKKKEKINFAEYLMKMKKKRKKEIKIRGFKPEEIEKRAIEEERKINPYGM